jgi:hypothetical protein
MPLSAIEVPYFKSELERYEQGDILRDVTLVEWADLEDARAVSVVERTLQYCVIVSQECDLEHDFNNRTKAESATNDKYLQSLLICPAYPSQSFRTGEHLKGVGLKMERITHDNWGRVKHNNNPRYHYLEPYPDLQIPELVVDFKHYVTIPRDVLYRDQFQLCYLASIEIMYRDNLSCRFAHYLSRIGLPELTSA